MEIIIRKKELFEELCFLVKINYFEYYIQYIFIIFCDNKLKIIFNK